VVQDFFDQQYECKRNKTSPKHSLQDYENFPRKTPISAAETEKQSFPGAFQLPRRGVAMEEGEWERACDQLGGVSQGGAIASTQFVQEKTWNSVGTSMSVCACSSFCIP